MRKKLTHVCAFAAVVLLLASCSTVPDKIARKYIYTPDLAYVNDDGMQYSLKHAKLIHLPPYVYPDGTVSSHERQVLATIFEVTNRSDRTQSLWRAEDRYPPNRREIRLVNLENAQMPLRSYRVIADEKLLTTECPSEHMDQRLDSFQSVGLYPGDTVTATLCWHNNGEIHLDRYDVLLIKATNANPDRHRPPFHLPYPWDVFAIPDASTSKSGT